ncbi:MAG: TRAP transporter substrate-binding protein DctP [Spirochaetales bacterium]|nr:TRAP transporter substrate-binding protein DctP [Spirochaetales bacterium]
MKKIGRITILLLGLLIISNAFAYSLTIKIASIAPENSPWGIELNKLAAEWKKISNGQVILKIYHNGIAGDEGTVLRKMNMGQLHGGIFTARGLTSIAPDITVISYPFLIKTEAELDYVLLKIKPMMNREIEAKGYKILAWSKAGWVRFFGKSKIEVPEDLKAHKLVSNPLDQAFLQTWKELGYHLVPLGIPDVLQGLNSGLVTALWASPIAAGTFQWFGIAKHMTNLKVAPLIGAILLSDNVWERIPDHLKPQLQQAVDEVADRLDNQITRLENEAIGTMVRYGLQIHNLTPAMIDQWSIAFKTGAERLLGRSMSVAMYNLIKKYVDEYRNQ